MTIGQELDNEFDALYTICQELELKLKNNADELVSFMKLQTETNENVHQSLSAIETILTQYGNRLSVLEEYHSTPIPPEPTPEPEPDIFPWPVYLLDLASNALMPLKSKSIEIDYDSNFTIQVGDGEALDVGRPVKFYLNGGLIGQENNVPIHAAGDNNPISFVYGPNSVKIEAGDGKTAEFLITKKETNPNPIPEPTPTNYEMQVGPWFPATFNLEDVFINFINPSFIIWEGGGMDTPALIENGYIDKDSGLPTGKSGSPTLQTGGFFDVGRYTDYMPLRDGDWVFECDAKATLKARNLRSDQQQQTDVGRLEFKRNAASGDTPWNERFILSDIDGPIKSLRLYRKEHEELIKSGKIYNPKFLENVSGYDIIRTMDLQSANAATIRSADDLATMKTPFWGSSDWSNAIGEDWRKWQNPFQGMPLEAVFKLGVESGKKVWMQCPITIGAPKPLFEFIRDDGRIDILADDFGKAAKEVAVEVIESTAWDDYADSLVQALIDSGYPEDRMLYISLANEVWNWVSHYFLTTKYAEHIGNGLKDYTEFGAGGARYGYGILLSRLYFAISNSLKKVNRNQEVTYVNESQAVWLDMTTISLKAMKSYFKKVGENWDDHKSSFGVSVATYWGWEDPTIYGVDVNNLNELENFFINGDVSQQGTLKSVVKVIGDTKTEAEKYGLKFIGAYEGGPHFGKPRSMDDGKYKEFVWGEKGGNVNYQINKALVDKYPGIILSNYALAGVSGGQPWFEDILNPDGPLNASWQRLIAEKNINEN